MIYRVIYSTKYLADYINYEFDDDEIIQTIPQEKSNKFEKNKFKILQIGA